MHPASKPVARAMAAVAFAGRRVSGGAAGRPMLWNNGRVCLMDVMAVLGDVMEVSMLEWASASMGELQLRGGSWPT